jgi:DNA-binding NarL/FixJ family response regulator
MTINAPRSAANAKVLIVDDHPVVRDGLVAQIAAQQDLEVCGEAEDVADALAVYDRTRPDIAVIDISLKSGNGLELVKRLRLRDDALRIVVWSMYPERLYAERALHAGAMGYVNKGSETQEILRAIRAVQAGKIYLSEEVSAQLLGRVVGGARRTIEQSPIESLSDRELEAFKLMGEGLTTERIAKTMHVSPKTVETYRARIKEKLGVSNFTELIHRATQWVAEHTG